MTTTERLELIAAYRTDPGLVRETNQDWAEIFWAGNAPAAAHKGDLFLVADGMGGHAGGEEASKFAVQKVAHTYRHAPSADPRAALERAIAQANAEIYREAAAQVGEAGAGTTLVGLLVRNGRALIVNVGDSRAYRVRAGHIEQITRDHSWVAQQQRAGALTARQARQHELRSTITRAVGAEHHVTPDFFERDIRPGDVFVLCTDGLTRHVSDATTRIIVTQYPPEEAADRLVQLARQRGGTDNVTVMVVRARRPAVVAGFRISELFSRDWWARRRPARLVAGIRQLANRLVQPVRRPANRPTVVAQAMPSADSAGFRISELFSLDWWARRRLSWSTPAIVGVVAALLLIFGLAGWALHSRTANSGPLISLPVRRAPIKYRVPRDTTLIELAHHFGYKSISEFASPDSSQAINPPQDGSFEQGRVPAGSEFLVQPAHPYYFVGGKLNNPVEETDSTTILEIATPHGQFHVSVPRDGERPGLNKGDPLRIFGRLPANAAAESSLQALLVQRFDPQSSRWTSWYAGQNLPQGHIWVYGNLAEAGFKPAIARARLPGEFVAVYGIRLANSDTNGVPFRWNDVYAFNEKDNAYVWVPLPANAPRQTPTSQPTRMPTATLRQG